MYYVLTDTDVPGVCVCDAVIPEQPILSGISSVMALDGEKICFKTMPAF